MIRDLLKWVAPGLVTVLGGTTAALSMATPAVVGEIARAGEAALQAHDIDWGDLTVSGRDLTLSGTVDSIDRRDIAAAALARVPGVRSISDTVTIATLAQPYLVHVVVEDGGVTLSGSVPNETMRQSLVARAGKPLEDLKVRSGQPNIALWQSGLDFALDQAEQIEAGELELSGLTLSVDARAKSQGALGALQTAFSKLPTGISSDGIQIDPMQVSPYTWSASFDGQRISISGYIPDEGIAERYRVASLGDVPVATGLSLASGAPSDFANQSTLLLQQLSRLEKGEVSIVDGVSRLSGTPRTIEAAQAVTESLSGTSSIVVLDPPVVGDYWMSITRQAGGTLVFDGYAPDEATRNAFGEVEGADVSFLKLGGGAPSVYRTGADFALDLLGHLSEGRVALNGNEMSISGTAATPTDFDTIRSLLETSLPEGIVVARAEYVPPRAATYNFSIRRLADGYVGLSGMLPSPEIEEQLLDQAGPQSTSDVTYASGEPTNFFASAEQAMNFLPWLRQGEIHFDGTGWTISGTPASTIDQGAIQTEFAVQGLAQAGWSLDLAAAAQPPQAVTPYFWSAERLPDGSFLFDGNVPAASLQSYLDVHVGTRVTDTSTVSLGAPLGFAAAVRAAVDALLGLEQGKATFDGQGWTLTGEAQDQEVRDASLALVSTALGIDASDGISLPAAEPYLWSASKSADGAVRFTGAVPAASLQRFLAVRGGEDVVDETTLREDAPEDFSVEILKALDLLALLEQGEVTFDGLGWSANGTLAASNDAAVTEILGENSAWQLALSESQPSAPDVSEPAVPDVAMTEPEPQSPVAQQAPQASPAEIAQCSTQLAELSQHNAILFQSGAAIIAASAESELDAFTAALALCPDSAVYVEGHTDSDGDDRQNLALSVARAEAVVNALIERGVAPERLYAAGYGESQPIADNASADGKRQNRRIVVSLRNGDS